VYNILSYIYAHLLVVISYLIAQCTVMDHLKETHLPAPVPWPGCLTSNIERFGLESSSWASS
jgi:hypothetical protein